jgi:hypothetical protein
LTGYSNNSLLWVACIGFWFILQKLEHSLGHLLKIMYVNQTSEGKGSTEVFSKIKKHGKVVPVRNLAPKDE